MAEIKDKVVTVDSLKAKHDYDEKTYLKKSESFHEHDYLPLSGGNINGDIVFTGEHGRIYGTDYSKDASGVVKEVLVGQTLDGNTSIGYGNYYEQSGSTNIYGDSITMTSRTSGLTEREYGVNEILWQGSLHMNAEQMIALSDNISHQPNGIVLVWSEYNSTTDTVQDQGFVTHFIPKILVSLHPTRFHVFNFTIWSYQSKQFVKGLYINDKDIAGHEINTDSSDQAAPVNSYVLRYVIGV